MRRAYVLVKNSRPILKPPTWSRNCVTSSNAFGTAFVSKATMILSRASIKPPTCKDQTFFKRRCLNNLILWKTIVPVNMRRFFNQKNYSKFCFGVSKGSLPLDGGGLGRE